MDSLDIFLDFRLKRAPRFNRSCPLRRAKREKAPFRIIFALPVSFCHCLGHCSILILSINSLQSDRQRIKVFFLIGIGNRPKRFAPTVAPTQHHCVSFSFRRFLLSHVSKIQVPRILTLVGSCNGKRTHLHFPSENVEKTYSAFVCSFFLCRFSSVEKESPRWCCFAVAAIVNNTHTTSNSLSSITRAHKQTTKQLTRKSSPLLLSMNSFLL